MSTTYSTILKIHKKVVGRRPPWSVGPATKDVEKKKGEVTPRKKIPTSRQVLTTTNEITSQKYFLYSKSYLGFLVFRFGVGKIGK